MENKDIFRIESHEFYGECLRDSVNGINQIKRPKNHVKIFELFPDGEKKQIYETDNLVLYIGREWIAQRIFNENNINVLSDPEYFVCWVGLGDGGAPLSDPLNPVAPTNNDVGLSNDIMINASDSTNADYRLLPVPGYYKQPIDSVIFEQDINNDNAYLVSKVLITVGADNGNGYNLNEAGLFAAESNAGGYSGTFTCYAKITFPSIPKTSSRILSFVWYIYC